MTSSESVPQCEQLSRVLAVGQKAEIDAALAQVGVDGELCEGCGRRSLHIAALQSRNSLCQYLLLQRGADPNVLDRKGRTPLHYACGRVSAVCLKTVRLMLDNGARADVLDDANQAPIDRALIVESVDTAELLLSAAPDWTQRHLSRKDADGRTMLHRCMERDLSESVLFLLRQSLDLYEPDASDVTPLDLLLDSSNVLLLHRILQHKVVRMFQRPTDAESPKSQKSSARAVFEMLIKIDSTQRSFQRITQELKVQQRRQRGDSGSGGFSAKALEECVNEQNLKKFLELMRQMPQFCISRRLLNSEMGQKFIEMFVKKAYIEENLELLQVLMHVMGNVSPVELTQRIEKQHLLSLYRECNENGLGVWTFVRQQLSFHSEEAFWHSLQAFLARLTGIDTADPDGSQSQIDTYRVFINPVRTYIVWTVVTGRYQRSFLNLCMRQFDAIPLGLYAVKILRCLSQRSFITAGVQDCLQEKADVMEQLMKSMMHEVFVNDYSSRKAVTCDFIRMRINAYGGHSIVSLAAEAKCGNFLSLPCCQDALDKNWFGTFFEHVSTEEMKSATYTAKRFALSAVALVPLLNVAVFFAVVRWAARRQRQQQQQQQQSSASKEENSATRRQSECSDNSLLHGHKEAAAEAEEEPESISGSRANLRQRPPPTSAAGMEALMSELDRVEELVGSTDLRRAVNRLTCFLDSPAVKFQYHLAAHLCMLCLLTDVVLFRFHHGVNGLELLVAVWFAGLAVEEAIEWRNSKSAVAYLADTWNVMDLGGIALFYFGFWLKVGLSVASVAASGACVPDFADARFYWIRLLYCLCLFLLYCRLLFYAASFKALGPKIRMISEMLVTDLLPFLLVLGVFMAAFAVSLQSLLFPNGFAQLRAGPELLLNSNGSCRELGDSRWSWLRVWTNMVEKAFYITVGEFFVEELKGVDCSGAGCPHDIGRVLVPTALNLLYILITNVLLLNLLIALFSKTVDEIQGNSTFVWYYNRHYTIEEFQRRLSLPSPLNVAQVASQLAARLQQLRCLLRTKLGRRQATARSRQLGARKESAVLRFLYFLVVQAMTLRDKRASLYLGVWRQQRLELSHEPEQQQHQQQQQLDERLSRMEEQLQSLRLQMEQLLRLHASGGSGASSDGSGSGLFHSASDLPSAAGVT